MKPACARNSFPPRRARRRARRRKLEPEPPEEAAKAARRTALDLLARREHSRLELAAKLENRGIDSAIITCLLDTLEQEDLLSDHRFAEEFVRSRVRRGSGPLKIGAELARRGIDNAVAGEVLAAYAGDWVCLAEAARAKRFGTALPRSFPERARQGRFLQTRGFSGEQIRHALKNER